MKSPPAERDKKYFPKEETFALGPEEEQDWKREMVKSRQQEEPGQRAWCNHRNEDERAGNGK